MTVNKIFKLARKFEIKLAQELPIPYPIPEWGDEPKKEKSPEAKPLTRTIEEQERATGLTNKQIGYEGDNTASTFREGDMPYIEFKDNDPLYGGKKELNERTYSLAVRDMQKKLLKLAELVSAKKSLFQTTNLNRLFMLGFGADGKLGPETLYALRVAKDIATELASRSYDPTFDDFINLDSNKLRDISSKIIVSQYEVDMTENAAQIQKLIDILGPFIKSIVGAGTSGSGFKSSKDKLREEVEKAMKEIARLKAEEKFIQGKIQERDYGFATTPRYDEKGKRILAPGTGGGFARTPAEGYDFILGGGMRLEDRLELIKSKLQKQEQRYINKNEELNKLIFRDTGITSF